MLLMLTLLACADECALPTDTTLYSREDLECGLGYDGEEYCRWRISFAADGSYTWSYSDVQQTGTWVCEADAVTGTGSGEQTYEGTWQPSREVLIWDGVEYVP